MFETFKNWRVWHLSFSAMDSSSLDWSESLISSLFLLRNVLFWVIVSIADFKVEIMSFIEDSDSWWRSFSSFKPCKTWQDCPVDMWTLERVTVLLAIFLHAAVFLSTAFPVVTVFPFISEILLPSLVELCEFRTLSAPVFWWAPLASPCAEMSERVTADWSILRPWKVARLSPVDFFCRMEDFCSVFKMRIWILSKISKILSKHVLQRAGGGFVLVSGIGLRNLMGSLYRRMTTKLTNDE